MGQSCQRPLRQRFGHEGAGRREWQQCFRSCGRMFASAQGSLVFLVSRFGQTPLSSLTLSPPHPSMADKAGGKPLDEVVVSRAIIETQTKVMMEHLDTDVAIVGAGPAGLTAAACLAGSGLRVSIFERKLGIGGGMLGGGMCFPRIVVQDAAVPLLHRFGVKTEEYQKGYFTANSVEARAQTHLRTHTDRWRPLLFLFVAEVRGAILCSLSAMARRPLGS